ncbi:sigma-70 family RNA polymerase sigma factor [Streptomyces sp. NPDC094032]|uniref:sigma-70 family RNA polymerase sigma factor n=1 Tax=Streptomyces sp. NPDC094032 TaxID=3155308 RepID=UPI003319AF61
MDSVEHRTAELVEAARAGDARAGDDLVRAYLPLVYNIVGRALDGHADVDDLVQDTMIRALDGLPGLRDPARFRSWLVAIAMNRIRHRWRERLQAPLPGLDGAAALADPAGDFTDLAILRLGLTGQRREVAEATRWLDAEDRELLSLWWLEAAGELTRAELAAALDVPPRHAAVRVQRMKARLETGRTVVRALAAAPPCPRLAETTAGWDGHPSPLWRKRLARHLDTCPHCAPTRTGLAPAEGLLVGFGLVPPLLVWAGRDGAGAGAGAGAMETVAWAGAGDGPDAGSHVPAQGAHRARRLWPVPVALLAILGAALLLVPDGPEARVERAEPRRAAPAPPPPATPTVTRTATPPPAPRPSPSPSRSRGPRPSVAERVNALVNAHRAEAGCGPLRTDPKLAEAARAYGRDMVARGYYGHTTPEGTDAGSRFGTVGYSWSAWAENLARGQADPASVVADWMADPPHRRNLLDCAYRDTGVAAVSGPDGTIWVQELAAPLG